MYSLTRLVFAISITVDVLLRCRDMLQRDSYHQGIEPPDLAIRRINSILESHINMLEQVNTQHIIISMGSIISLFIILFITSLFLFITALEANNKRTDIKSAKIWSNKGRQREENVPCCSR